MMHFTGYSRAVGAVIVLTGSAVLAGWAFDIVALKSVLPGLVTMKANVALGFIVAGISLWLSDSGRTDGFSADLPADRIRHVAGQVCAGYVVAIGLLTLSQYLFGWDLGIDQMLFREPAAAVATFVPGRTSPAVAFNFLLVGLGLFFLYRRSGAKAAQLLCSVAMVVSLLAVIGYAYGVQALYKVGVYTAMAVHTALAFVVLSAGVIWSRASTGFAVVALAASGSAAGSSARLLLPAAIIVPVALGWLRLAGERAGLYGTEFGLAIFALSNIVIFATFVLLAAFLLERRDAARRQADAAVRRTESMFRQLFESAPDPEIAVNHAGIIVRVNAEATRVFGYGREQMLNQPVEMLMPDRLREPHVGLRGTYMAAPRTRPMGAGLDLYARRKDGSEFPVEISLSPMETEEGYFVVSVIRDVTRQKKAEQALKELADELARSNTDLQQFAFAASHDLQEPLRAVAGCTQILQKRYADKLDARADELIEEAVQGATRMQSLVNDLLEFSRVGSRGQPLKRVDARQSLEDALHNLAVTIRESGAVVTHDPMPEVLADATQLAVVFQNLVANAIKFRGDQRPEIHVGAERRPGEWRFFIRDNGIGIEPQYFERIFLVFQRLHTRKESPGTGIGLALCKRNVERHGGRIWVESEVGKGSTFYFTILERS